MPIPDFPHFRPKRSQQLWDLILSVQFPKQEKVILLGLRQQEFVSFVVQVVLVTREDGEHRAIRLRGLCSC